MTTATLPDGWRERIVAYSPAAANGATGRCLEPHDLVLSKLVAGRMKDFEFVVALLDADLVDLELLHQRAQLVRAVPMQVRRIEDWLDAYARRRKSQRRGRASSP
ncbi:MAG: DUF6036 family nucleotidyltransferase [Ornithinimicrobium sp.]